MMCKKHLSHARKPFKNAKGIIFSQYEFYVCLSKCLFVSDERRIKAKHKINYNTIHSNMCGYVQNPYRQMACIPFLFMYSCFFFVCSFPNYSTMQSVLGMTLQYHMCIVSIFKFDRKQVNSKQKRSKQYQLAFSCLLAFIATG